MSGVTRAGLLAQILPAFEADPAALSPESGFAALLAKAGVTDKAVFSVNEAEAIAVALNNQATSLFDAALKALEAMEAQAAAPEEA